MRLISPDALAIVTIFQEAEGEPYEGKVAVAEVIRRRMSRKYSSDGTIEGTVLRALQFSGWNANSANRIRSLRIDMGEQTPKDCEQAWLDSKTSGLAPDAVLYFSTLGAYRPPWADETKYVTQIGNHRFFKA